MNNNSIEGTIVVNAPAAIVWDAITNPAKIVQYTGSNTETDWKEGSPITWSGEMHGTRFQNKGKVLENTPNSLLQFTYWSGMGGDADLPENYSEITYTLQPTGDSTTELTYSRVKIATELETQIFRAHLQSMLNEIKRIAEE